MVISVYAIFCINDIFGMTKSKSSVTVNYTQDIESTSDAIDLLADYDLITCKNFCKFYIKLASAVVGITMLPVLSKQVCIILTGRWVSKVCSSI